MRILIAIILAGLLVPAPAPAQVPPQFTYQGVLQDASGDPVPDGTVLVRFRLYDVATGGLPLWTETKNVTTEGGLFSTILGDLTALTLPFDETYWLEIVVSGEGAMTPRTQLTAVPYAIHALSAVAGDDGDWVIAGDNIYRLTGQVAIGTTPLSKKAGPVRKGQDGSRVPTETKLFVEGDKTGIVAKLIEPDAAADERAAVYAVRGNTVRNDGAGYGYNQTNNAVFGHNADGDSYTFGVAGYTWFDWPRTGGVLGANGEGTTWGALAYRDGSSANWGMYTPGAAYVGATLVTNYFQMPVGHAQGEVLTSDLNGFGTWQPLPTGFALPYTGSVSFNGPAFDVTNTYVGTNAAIKGQSGGYYGGHFTSSRASSSTHAVHGEATAASNSDAKGVYGKSMPGDNWGYGGYFEGGYKGVYAHCQSTAVSSSANYYGVHAVVDGIYGYTFGVRGDVPTGDGFNYGVYGRADGLGQNYGIYGTANNGVNDYAGYFHGNVHVNGTLSKSAGSFKIDHPLDPGNKYLSHSFVESPDMMNVYNGNVLLDASGSATVEMPAWFEALNREFRYQLTAIGGPGPNLHVAGKMAGNRFQIAGGTAGLEVSWQVTGIRHDPYAEAHRIPVEQDKRPDERGKYLNPTSYGAAESAGLHRAAADPKGEDQP